MKKSGDEILHDIYTLIKDSEFIAMLTGDLYMDGTMRPLNSTKEDTVMSFKTGLDGQIQEGAILLHIYIPNIDSGAGGWTKSIPRTEAVSKKANEFFNGDAIGGYYLRIGNMVETRREEKTGQHYVRIDLRFKRIIYFD